MHVTDVQEDKIIEESKMLLTVIQMSLTTKSQHNILNGVP